MIKTFRGLLADQGQDRIRLSTKKGKIGYRIVKFQLFPAGSTSTFSYESFGSIFKVSQTSVPADGVPDFSNGHLLACGYYTQHGSGAIYPEDLNVIFDNEIFNQDIFITHSNSESSAAINYYLELEVTNLTDNAAAVSTLRDIRITENTV
tara:strand:- start:42 stop:491 length:450 start_codon:yes stop_codon:yes gene_type:complete